MGTFTIIGIIIVALLAGMESVLDQFEFHQPILACTLVGIVAGDPVPCIILGGTLQMIALGWANIGAAVAPDAAFASVASAIIWYRAARVLPVYLLLLVLQFLWQLLVCSPP